jgi:hypothetical protein
MWRLGQERKVFIDGRILFEDVYETSVLVSAARSEETGGLP